MPQEHAHEQPDRAALLAKVEALGHQHAQPLIEELRGHAKALDQRWVSIGLTHIQEGLMALRRSIEQPSGF